MAIITIYFTAYIGTRSDYNAMHFRLRKLQTVFDVSILLDEVA